jgi:hypothetical protein
MEIRNALQKIENYLTVVSNLNKTILSEGTMSRDELLLMKKYLYTSIDRIEDIEKSLVINQSEDKSFTPAQPVAQVFVPKIEKDIVEVQQQTDVEALEAAIEEEFTEISPVTEQEEIVAEMQQSIADTFIQQQSQVVEEEIPAETFSVAVIDIAPVAENIITEDYAVNQQEQPLFTEESTNDFVAETIITEDYAVNQFEENYASGISEDIPVFETQWSEEVVLNQYDEVQPVAESEVIPVINEIITEDYALNRSEAMQEVMAATSEDTAIKEEKVLTLADQFVKEKPATLADVLAETKSAEVPFFQKFEQKTQQHMFELFEEDTTQDFSAVSGHTASSFLPEQSQAAYENESVLVIEKEVETVVEQLTPSSLNEVFKPKTVVANLNSASAKTLSESIALNDKFIFVRELFGNQFAEYEKGLKQLDMLSSYTDADAYCKENFWSKFNWNDKTTAVVRFSELLQKRFN